MPSPELVATVRHARPPDAPPDDLVPFVVPVVVDGQLDDWHLGADALAFADRDVPSAFATWRSRWERTWTLDPVASVRRLCSAADELVPPGGHGSGLVVGMLGAVERGSTTIDPEVQPALVAVLRRVQQAVRARGGAGYGFVDATAGRGPTGFVRSWSPQDGAEVLAADELLVASMRPRTGLSITGRAPEGVALARRCDLMRSTIVVHAVELAGGSVQVSGPSGSFRLGLNQARVLGWLVPGSARWRVRPIPEVLVWARTFAGLADGCAYASSIGASLAVSASRPFVGSCP